MALTTKIISLNKRILVSFFLLIIVKFRLSYLTVNIIYQRSRLIELDYLTTVIITINFILSSVQLKQNKHFINQYKYNKG